MDRISDWVLVQAQCEEKLPSPGKEESSQRNGKKKQERKKKAKIKSKEKKTSREAIIAYFLIDKRIRQLQDVWYANLNAKSIDDIIVSSNVCLLKISEKCVAGHVTYKHLSHISDDIHRNLGTLILSKCKFPNNISEHFIQDMLRCFFGLSRYELTVPHHLVLTHMALLLHPNLQRKCRDYLSSITYFSPLHMCYATTLLVRIELNEYGYTRSMDMKDIIHQARQGVDAAKKSLFVPWLFVSYMTLLFSLVRHFGRMRLMNRPYAPHHLFPLCKMQQVREDIIQTLDQVNALKPYVPDEGVQRFMSAADQIIRTDVTCLDMPKGKCVDPLCYSEPCPFIMKELFPWGDPMAKLEGVPCYPSFQPLRQEKIYEKRPPPSRPWAKFARINRRNVRFVTIAARP